MSWTLTELILATHDEEVHPLTAAIARDYAAHIADKLASGRFGSRRQVDKMEAAATSLRIRLLARAA